MPGYRDASQLVIQFKAAVPAAAGLLDLLRCRCPLDSGKVLRICSLPVTLPLPPTLQQSTLDWSQYNEGRRSPQPLRLIIRLSS